MRKIADNSLYLVISQEYCRGRTAVEIAKAAIGGGVDMIQMREKDRPRRELIRLGKELAGLCEKYGVTFIVNDDPAIAKDVSADGVHLGQEDLKRFPVKRARELVGEDGIIGVSTHSVEEFEKANEDDVDYIAYGPVFPTKTKDYFLGTGDVKKVLALARKPTFFIGGINLSNVDELVALGAKKIALIRGIAEAQDVRADAADFRRRLENKGE